MIGLAAAIAAQMGLATVGGYSLWLRDPVYFDRESFLSRLRTQAPPGSPAVVMLGTSRGGYGFHAKRCSKRLSAIRGQPVVAFNFALAGAGPVTQNIHLARLLSRGQRPDFLLIELPPASVAIGPNAPLEGLYVDGRRFWHAELDVLASYEIRGERIREQWRETIVAPWFAYRFSLLGRLTPALVPLDQRLDLGRSGDEYGWHPIREETFTAEKVAEGRERAHREYADTLRDLQPGGPAERALRDTIRLAREHGIPTWVVLMPESTWFREMYPPEVAARFDRWINGLTREMSCPLIDARSWVPDDQFADGHHLLTRGAVTFTDRLADEIAPRMTPPKGAQP